MKTKLIYEIVDLYYLSNENDNLEMFKDLIDAYKLMTLKKHYDVLQMTYIEITTSTAENVRHF